MTTIRILIMFGLIVGSGLTNLVLLPGGFRAARSSAMRLTLLVLPFIGMAAMCYFLTRSGYVSDEQHIGGDQVAPFYGTEWYWLLFFEAVGILCQVRWLRKTLSTKQ